MTQAKCAFFNKRVTWWLFVRSLNLVRTSNKLSSWGNVLYYWPWHNVMPARCPAGISFADIYCKPREFQFNFVEVLKYLRSFKYFVVLSRSSVTLLA